GISSDGEAVFAEPESEASVACGAIRPKPIGAQGIPEDSTRSITSAHVGQHLDQKDGLLFIEDASLDRLQQRGLCPDKRGSEIPPNLVWKILPLLRAPGGDVSDKVPDVDLSRKGLSNGNLDQVRDGSIGGR